MMGREVTAVPDPSIELHLDAEASVVAQAFAEAVQAFVPLVREADCDATWVIEDLRLASAHVTIAAHGAGAGTQGALTRIVDGLSELREHARIPDGFTRDMVRCARDLARAARGISVISAGKRVEADSSVAEHAQEALTGHAESIGSVEGVFDRLNDRGSRHEVGLLDRSGLAVSCTFDDALRDEVIEAIRTKKRVVAWGRLRRNAAGQKAQLHLWDLEEVESTEPRSITELVGILGPGWKGDLNSVEFVRAQRES
jgi:hypothetical protein